MADVAYAIRRRIVLIVQTPLVVVLSDVGALPVSVLVASTVAAEQVLGLHGVSF
jgi:hypothetical protein